MKHFLRRRSGLHQERASILRASHLRASRLRESRRPGFTLVEILVVLAIVALLSAILFAAFKSVREGNNKSSCQGNLVQIYQATRLYAQDFNGELPYYNAGAVAGAPQNGLGLWALYGYPPSNNLDCDGLTTELPDPDNTQSTAAPLASYIKSPRIFHCPLDGFERPAATVPAGQNGCKVPAGTPLKTDVLQYTGTDGKAHINPFFLSYQGLDSGISTSPAGINRTKYSSFRTSGTKRQLLFYTSGNSTVINPSVRARDNTVLAWCPFHRALNSDGTTIDKPSNFDNVLFLDGTVQYVPTTQNIGGQDCQGWKRLPIDQANTAQGCPN